VDDQVIRLCLLHLSVVNAPVFGGVLGFQVPGAKVDDSRLDVLAIEDTPIPLLIAALLRVLFGKRWRTRGAALYHVSGLQVEAERPIDVSLDGEIVGKIPGHFELTPRALHVITAPDFLKDKR
jgi:diacylglycerol kinase family enzyme